MTATESDTVRCGRPTRQRVLEAIRTLFRRTGYSPSHSEIAEMSGIAVKRVQRYVEQLATDGYLVYRKRERRSILLVDRGAMLSDAELELTAHGRNAVITWSAVPGLGRAYPVEVGPHDPDADLLKRLA